MTCTILVEPPHVSLGATPVGALLDGLDSDDLGALAERLAPYFSPPEPDEWMNAREAAAHLGVSVKHLHRLTADDRVPCHRDCPGGRLAFRRSELDDWRREA